MNADSSLDICIGLLQCDNVMPDLASEYGDYPEMFRHLFAMVSPSLRYRCYNLTQMEFPASLSECDAWLFTGSKWSVYDDEPWIHRARELAHDLHEAGKPVVGICFGHQLIAEALGGKVARSENGWGVGLHEAQVIEKAPWMVPDSTHLRLLVSHQDQVIDLPKEARRLAGHGFCPNDIVQIGRNTLTFQGHPEFSPGYSKALMDKREGILGPETYRNGLDSLRQEADKQQAAQWILNFICQALESK